MRIPIMALALVIFLLGCRSPDGATINIFNNLIGSTPTTGGQAPSPAPGGDLPPNSRLAILQYGQTCPPGVTIPRNGTRECKMGCNCDYTCTPKFPDGTDIPSEIHGPIATWAVLAGGEHVSVRRDNFNLHVIPVSPGPFTLQCTVRNLVGIVDAAVVSPGG
jgi:hypothetical protein